MDSRIEKLIFAKDFQYLSSEDKFLVTQFMSEQEYVEYRDFLMKSKHLFKVQKGNWEEPLIDKDILSSAYNKKYVIPNHKTVLKSKKFKSSFSDTKYLAIAAAFILFCFVCADFFIERSFKIEQQEVTDYLLYEIEPIAIMESSSMENNTRNFTDKSLQKHDSLLLESKEMIDHLKSVTYALELEILVPKFEQVKK